MNELQKYAILCAEFDGWEIDPANNMRKGEWWRQCTDERKREWHECTRDELIKHYLSLDNLVPVWEKLKLDYIHVIPVLSFGYEVILAKRIKGLDVVETNGHWKTFQEAALLATGKAIELLGE